MQEYLQSEIAKRLDEIRASEARIAELMARVSELRVEARVLTDVLAHVPEVTHNVEREAKPELAAPERTNDDAERERTERSAPVNVENGRGDEGREKSGKASITTGHRLAEKWAVVRDEAVRRYPETIKNREAPSVQQRHGYKPASSANVRTHFYGGVQAGLYERVAHGVYRATQKAADTAGFPLGAGRAQADSVTTPQTEEGPDSGEPSGPFPLLMGAA